MTIDNFISYLQQLLTMIDPNDKYSVALGKSALSATIGLAISSDKTSPRVHRAMFMAEREFVHLAENAEDFAGKPGEYEENRRRRRRLLTIILPSC